MPGIVLYRPLVSSHQHMHANPGGNRADTRGPGKVPGCPVGAASSPARGNYALRSCCVVGSYQGVIQPPSPGGSVSHLRWPLI